MEAPLHRRLHALTAAERAGCLDHPFVRGIGDGSLPPRVFARWVVQDWCYLQAYVEVLEALAAAAPLDGDARRWRDLAALTRDDELDLHRRFAARFGITREALDDAVPWPATVSYTTFLRDAAAAGYATGVTAVLPCAWGYVELARSLAAGPTPADPRYAAWIDTYTDPAFAEAVAWMEAAVDHTGAELSDLRDTALAGAHHERAFWDALWAGGATGR